MREALRQDRWIPIQVWMADSLEPADADSVCGAASRLDVPVVRKSLDDLTRRCGSAAHQGLLAKMPPFPYRSLPDVIQGASQPALLLVLDRIQDPHNLGAMIRSAEVFGADGVIIGTSSQCGVTASVVRSSAGAIHHVPVAQVDDLTEAVRELSRHAIRIVATSGEAETAATAVELARPVAIVVGNEGVGIDPELLTVSDEIVRIPQFGRVGSLNAAVAAGILLYEARRQRTSGQA